MPTSNAVPTKTVAAWCLPEKNIAAKPAPMPLSAADATTAARVLTRSAQAPWQPRIADSGKNDCAHQNSNCVGESVGDS
jgi:hypothetical protein